MTTLQDLDLLQNNLISTKDRGEFYISQFALTGGEASLLEGHVSMFSGVAGGNAFSANYLLADQVTNGLGNYNFLYDFDDIYIISQEVAVDHGLAATNKFVANGEVATNQLHATIWCGTGWVFAGGSLMKKIFLVSALLFIGGPVYLWYDFLTPSKSNIDPACFESDTIRLEIGGERYDFPREIIRSMRGGDVVNSQDSGDRPPSQTSSGSKACQKNTDKRWNLHNINLDFYFVPCPANRPQKCITHLLSVDIISLDEKSNFDFRINRNANTKEQLLQSCTPPAEPWNDAHEKSWSRCSYHYENNNLSVLLRFKGGIYTPTQIEQTVLDVNNEIAKYRTK